MGWRVDISCVLEVKRIGTSEPLSLLSERPEKALVVMDGDLLTKLNFAHLLDFHRKHDVADGARGHARRSHFYQSRCEVTSC
jgi:NDP-sugar pyrophosphorylase family protein